MVRSEVSRWLATQESDGTPGTPGGERANEPSVEEVKLVDLKTIRRLVGARF